MGARRIFFQGEAIQVCKTVDAFFGRHPRNTGFTVITNAQNIL